MSRVTMVLLAISVVIPVEAGAQAVRQGMLSMEGARLFYEVIGAGDPVIVVHGGPGLDHEYLRPGLDVLATRQTLVYYDQRGTGRSSAELVDSVINLDAFVEDIDALRQALGYERVSVMGHSFGALLALEYAARYPANTRALILLDPVEPGQRFQAQTADRQAERRTPEDVEDMSALRSTEAFEARDAGTLSQFYRVAFRQIMRDRTRIDEVRLDLSGTTARYGQDVAALLGRSMGTVDWWNRLSTIEAPTLVVHGRHDAPPVEMAQALADAFPNGTLALVDSGHFPWVEDRDGLVRAVSSFFAALRR